MALGLMMLLLADGIVPAAGVLLSQRRSASLRGQRQHTTPQFEVVEKTSIEATTTKKCLCEAGSFWHWRINQCIKQGSWGYECGFFPGEHHQYVCKDGLHCEVLDQSGREVKTKYLHEGAVPASCQHCKAEDDCKTGEDRDCLEETTIAGEACATVRVTAEHTATAEATKEHTAEAEHTATATATAETKANATATGSVTGEAAGIKAEVTKEATASAEASATATEAHTAKAETTAKATAAATATETGVAEAKKCVSVDEVKKALDLMEVPRMGPVLAARVIAKGDKMAFELAYEAALKKAIESGALAAEDAAKALAASKAAQDAALEAEAKAAEEAAWKAEAGAADAASAAAEDEAGAKAKELAAAEAADAAAAKAAGSKDEAQAAAEAAAEKVADVSSSAANDGEVVARPTEAPPEVVPRKMTEKDVRDKKP